jgi:hypothetical protein
LPTDLGGRLRELFCLNDTPRTLGELAELAGEQFLDDARFHGLESSLNARFEAVDVKLEALDVRIDSL